MEINVGALLIAGVVRSLLGHWNSSVPPSWLPWHPSCADLDRGTTYHVSRRRTLYPLRETSRRPEGRKWNSMWQHCGVTALISLSLSPSFSLVPCSEGTEWRDYATCVIFVHFSLSSIHFFFFFLIRMLMFWCGFKFY